MEIIHTKIETHITNLPVVGGVAFVVGGVAFVVGGGAVVVDVGSVEKIDGTD